MTWKHDAGYKPMAKTSGDNRLGAAIALAAKAHQDHTDKLGKPYILHPLAVMGMVDTDEEKVVAALHDVVEDSDVSIRSIRRLFGEEVAQAVDALTRKKGERRTAYYSRVRGNQLALKVKLADVAHNSSPARINGLPPKTRIRLKDRYAKARRMLTAADSSPQL